MPYAPGVAPHAGEIFAASQFGSRISENVQNWMKNRQEREQTTATAEMLGRYLKDDPHAMEMFGEKFSDIPKGSAAQARATIGAATVYIADRYRKAQVENMKADNERANKTLKLQEDQLALSQQKAARESAEAAKYDRFGQLVDAHFRQPTNVQIPYAAERVPFTAEDLVRYQAKAGIAGLPGSAPMISAFSRYSAKTGGNTPKSVMLEGVPFAFSDKTGQFQEIKKPTVAPDGGLKAIPVMDDDGTVRSYVFQNRNGGYQQLGKEHAGLTATQEVGISKRLDEVRTAIARAQRDISSNPKDKVRIAAAKEKLEIYQTELDHLEGLRKPPVTAGPVRPPVGPAPGMGDRRMAERATDQVAPSAPEEYGPPVPPEEYGPPAPPPQPEEEPAETPPAPTEDTSPVRVVSPDGKVGHIPANQLERALKKGYKRAE